MTTATLKNTAATRFHRPTVLYIVLFASGFAGLGYQALWTRMLAIQLGHEFTAVLGVLCAFFAGLGLGAWLLDKPIARSARPHLWFAGLEAVIGIWAAALIWLLPFLGTILTPLLSAAPPAWLSWLATFALPFIVLAPATFAMGGTLPAADRVMGQVRKEGFGLAGVYAANTFGAVIGIYALIFLLMPMFGFNTSLCVLVSVNITCAAILSLSFDTQADHKRDLASADVQSWKPLFILAGLGLLGIGFEVVMIRALSQILENTVYSYASVLGIYLLGTALGASFYHQFPRLKRVGTGRALIGLSAACLLSVLALWPANGVYQMLAKTIGALWGEMAVGAMTFLLPTCIMGALFAHLAASLRRHAGGVGVSLAANTAGAALSAIIFGLLVMPTLGVVQTLVAIALGYAAIAIVLKGHLVGIGLTALGACVLVLSPLKPSLLELPEGAKLLMQHEGVLGTVNVYEDASSLRYLKLNNGYVMGGTGSKVADRRQGHIPLLLHPYPKRALFLGVGTGVTFASAAYHPNLEADAVELVPDILDVLPQFSEVNAAVTQSDSLSLQMGDARRYVEASTDTYDVIVSDTFHPSRDGAGLLYTVEHFQSIKDRLSDGGLFVQWLPFHQLDEETFRLILRSYLAVFPGAYATLNDLSLETPVIGLISGIEGLSTDRDVLAHDPLRVAMRESDLATRFGPLDGIIAGPEGLNAFAGTGPLNTDDHPRVVFEAPRLVYAGLEDHGARLLQLLQKLIPADARDLFSGNRAKRLGRMWVARDLFLDLGVNRPVAPDQAALVSQMAPKLLEIVRISPDFAPAYDPLIEMAGFWMKSDPSKAYELLIQIHQANPTRGEANALLERWFRSTFYPEEGK